MDLFKNLIGFDWDSGNRNKNLIKHKVTNEECEETFFDPHKRVLKAGTAPGAEERHLLIGQTRQRKLLFVVFTIRKNKVRVISARDLNRKERKLYEETT